jgi:SPP1 gp7 family putative phage head morphogenesis protein
MTPAAVTFATQARAQRGGLVAPRRRPRVMRRAPRPREPVVIERAYGDAILAAVIEPLVRHTREIVLPALPGLVAQTPATVNPNDGAALVIDGFADTIDRIIARMAEEWERDGGGVTEGPIERDVSRFAAATSAHNRDELRRQFAAQLRIEPVIGDDGVPDLLDGWERTNIDLVKSIPRRYHEDLKALLVRQVTAGARHEAIAREIQERWLVPVKTRPDGTRAPAGLTYTARRLARDQINKLNGNVNGARQRGLGITRYRWRTSLDERVRREHAEREGDPFEWANPPHDGHPGEAVWCRCSAEAILEDVLERLGV